MAPKASEALEADYVIVGGGSAGCVLANRLSEDPGTRVLLLEAGGEARSPLIALPVGYAKLVTDPRFDWNYAQAPDASLNGRRWVWSAGKVLGGGGAINGQVFIRGTRHDFDRWAEAGATGWSFREVFPYFLRSESWQGAPSQAHGAHGPLAVSPMRHVHPLARAFLEACRACGVPTLDEYNDGSDFGAFLTQTNQLNGVRCSPEKAFLRPARQRANLQVVTSAEVERIRFDGRRAVGVEFVQGGVRRSATARREVIASAGTIGTSALLMRSGVGAAERLRALDIGVIHDLPGVGENLQEHPAAGVSREVNVPTFNTQTGGLAMVGHLAQFLARRRGLLTTPAVQAMAFARTDPQERESDVQLHFAPVGGTMDADTPSPVAAVLAKEPAVTLYASLCKPKGRGRVELQPDGRPLVRHELVGNEDDMRTLVAGMKLVSRVLDAPALAKVTVGPRSPKPVPVTDDGWVDHIRASGVITWHPVGTCRMGSDTAAVVDPALRVRGVEGLRVVDASVMPTTSSGNTHAPTLMIAEKAADMIRQD